MGMLLLGAFVATHERTGLDGFIAAGPITPELRPYSAHDRRTKSDPFGVWPVPADLMAKGLVTDDTGVRVMFPR
jgi:hypothetical protein